MNILVVRGNPRKNGYTQRITDLVVDGARKGGASIVDIDLQQKKVTPCIGCYHCWTVTPGACRFQDDMPELLEHFLNANIVLCSTPLYYYSVSSAMKTFLERTLPLTMQGFEDAPSGLMRNRTREVDVAHDPEQSARNRPLHAVPGRRVGLRPAAAHERHTRRRGKMRRAGPLDEYLAGDGLPS